MPGFFFRYKLNRADVDKKVSDAKQILSTAKKEEFDKFIIILTSRLSEFIIELDNPNNDSSEKELIMEQYNRFASTLLRCVRLPQKAQGAISSYQTSIYYYPVGIKDVEKPNQTAQALFQGGFALGLVLLFATTPAFIFNPGFGAILLVLAITSLLPSSLYLATPDAKNTETKKAEEKNIFVKASQLIDPELKFDEPTSYYQPILDHGMM